MLTEALTHKKITAKGEEVSLDTHSLWNKCVINICIQSFPVCVMSRLLLCNYIVTRWTAAELCVTLLCLCVNVCGCICPLSFLCVSMCVFFVIAHLFVCFSADEPAELGAGIIGS